jgi:two-component system, OmpR family, phosphate regulon response regulator PhoB
MARSDRKIRDAAEAPARIELGNLTIDFVAQRARWRAMPIALGPSEFDLLGLFAQHPDRVHSRANLIAMMGKDGQAIDERTVDVWVGRLRRALKAQDVPVRLRTVRAMGYVYDSV